MAPHPQSEAHSFAHAFEACDRGLHELGEGLVKDENALHWITTIRRLMNTYGVSDPTGEGTHLHRVRAMTEQEKYEFSRAVDELAHWFDREFWTAMG